MREAVELNGTPSGNGTVGKIVEFNDIKLPSDDVENMFANASGFASRNLEYFKNADILNGKKVMCTIVPGR